MPFFAEDCIGIPTRDILSWACDEPQYDQHRPLYIDATDPSKFITAAEAKVFIRKLVAGFKNAGLLAGDSVCIHSFNHIFYPVIVLGIIGAGGVFTGTNPSYTSHELNHHLKSSKAKFVFSEVAILETVKTAATELGIPQTHMFVLDTDDDPVPSGLTTWRSLLEYGEADWLRFEDLETAKNTTAMLLFSSGTTGLPKPAMVSHYNLVAEHTLVFEYKPRPYTLSRIVPLPMFHAATAPSTHTSALRSGHATYIMRRFDVNAYISNIERYKITDLILVPPMVLAIVSSPLPEREKRKALTGVKACLAGAAPLDKKMQARFQALLPTTTPFTQVWAMTETSCFASLFHYPQFDNTGSVGIFLPNLDVKLVDGEGNDISAYDVTGELCIRGPTVIQGYLGVEEANRRDFDEDGYFHTGDILYCDGKTKLWYIIDRKKELIKVRGFQVAPAELEGVLLTHPHVLDAAVIGIQLSADDSELPRAYIVRKPGLGQHLSEEEVKSHLSSRLARYKRLEGGVKFIDAIPKTASGKILKRLLREQAKKEMGAKL